MARDSDLAKRRVCWEHLKESIRYCVDVVEPFEDVIELGDALRFATAERSLLARRPLRFLRCAPTCEKVL